MADGQGKADGQGRAWQMGREMGQRRASLVCQD